MNESAQMPSVNGTVTDDRAPESFEIAYPRRPFIVLLGVVLTTVCGGLATLFFSMTFHALGVGGEPAEEPTVIVFSVVGLLFTLIGTATFAVDVAWFTARRETLTIKTDALVRTFRCLSYSKVTLYSFAKLDTVRFVAEHWRSGVGKDQLVHAHLASSYSGKAIKLAHGLSADQAREILRALADTGRVDVEPVA
ncbi:MAG: hypothetical protein JJ908_08715 [Rhizobiales bacterium]|nr:hypothetical protein [Hyphomicrobiales bacterium]MBO6697307.1 hypothetical protein [Hyphomicrobiales bacterium]MBO6736438.1 hypothetical protein [Hyphomicrobiales bacterium]MBO6912908.1 hypothetical protein [Hyphomicrobiales bacterium]MBO6954076.1 hypothetical protein [Hyphomicrobiales bacterium]